MRNSPVDVVKIDGAFLKNIESNLVDFALLQSINEIAHLLGKRTVARARQFREHPPTFGRNRDSTTDKDIISVDRNRMEA
jgi:hypothetical protein